MLWIDGVQPTIHRYHPATGVHTSLAVPVAAPLGMIAQTTDPSVLALAQPEGIVFFNVETRTMTTYGHPEAGREGIGYNDAKVDPQGRLWVGTYDSSETEPRGTLWLFPDSGPAVLVDAGFVVVNGPAFSPDGKQSYLSDSTGKRIYAYEVRSAAPWLGPRRVFAAMTADEGLPDGLTVDGEGCVWCAHWDGARVTRFSPQGERLMVISLPARRVTSVAFGCAKLDTLYITTARYGCDEAELNRTPDAGGLFSARPGVTGLPATLLPLPR